MDYSFKVIQNEDKMKNYFRDLTGRLVRDTILVTIKNNGNKPWGEYKGYFKCLKEKSNIYFDTFFIPKDVNQNETREFVLYFPRIEENFNSGKMICTLQLVYNQQTYNEETIQFTKTFDITGNTVIRVRKEKEAEKLKKEEEEKKRREEELKKYLKPGDEIVEVEGESDLMSNAIKKFRTIFDMPEGEFDDDYVKSLIVKSDYDFNYAFNIHIDSIDSDDTKSEELLSDDNKFNELKDKLRNKYVLPKEDFSDEVIEDALIDGKGNLYKSFAKLMALKKLF